MKFVAECCERVLIRVFCEESGTGRGAPVFFRKILKPGENCEWTPKPGPVAAAGFRHAVAPFIVSGALLLDPTSDKAEDCTITAEFKVSDKNCQLQFFHPLNVFEEMQIRYSPRPIVTDNDRTQEERKRRDEVRRRQEQQTNAFVRLVETAGFWPMKQLGRFGIYMYGCQAATTSNAAVPTAYTLFVSPEENPENIDIPLATLTVPMRQLAMAIKSNILRKWHMRFTHMAARGLVDENCRSNLSSLQRTFMDVINNEIHNAVLEWYMGSAEMTIPNIRQKMVDILVFAKTQARESPALLDVLCPKEREVIERTISSKGLATDSMRGLLAKYKLDVSLTREIVLARKESGGVNRFLKHSQDFEHKMQRMEVVVAADGIVHADYLEIGDQWDWGPFYVGPGEKNLDGFCADLDRPELRRRKVLLPETAERRAQREVAQAIDEIENWEYHEPFVTRFPSNAVLCKPRKLPPTDSDFGREYEWWNSEYVTARRQSLIREGVFTSKEADDEVDDWAGWDPWLTDVPVPRVGWRCR